MPSGKLWFKRPFSQKDMNTKQSIPIIPPFPLRYHDSPYQNIVYGGLVVAVIFSGVVLHDDVEGFHFFVKRFDELHFAMRHHAAVLHAIAASHLLALEAQLVVGAEYGAHLRPFAQQGDLFSGLRRMQVDISFVQPKIHWNHVRLLVFTNHGNVAGVAFERGVVQCFQMCYGS